MEAKEAYYRGKRDLLGRKGDLLTQPYLRRARLPSAPQASLSNPVGVWVCVGVRKRGERDEDNSELLMQSFGFSPVP